VYLKEIPQKPDWMLEDLIGSGSFGDANSLQQGFLAQSSRCRVMK
jgi:hypothetical protein